MGIMWEDELLRFLCSFVQPGRSVFVPSVPSSQCTDPVLHTMSGAPVCGLSVAFCQLRLLCAASSSTSVPISGATSCMPL